MPESRLKCVLLWRAVLQEESAKRFFKDDSGNPGQTAIRTTKEHVHHFLCETGRSLESTSFSLRSKGAEVVFRYFVRPYSGNGYLTSSDGIQQLGLADAIAAYEDREIWELKGSQGRN